MYAQTNYGMYSRCLNRECRKPYTKQNHRGFNFKSPTEVFVVMECYECKQSYTLVQLVMLAHEYYRRLPATTQNIATNLNEITAAEVRKARKILDGDNYLSLLSEQIHPDAPRPPRDE